MPGVSKTQRAEAKYNVTLEFPHLGLHSAAATGNVGLVKYALDHGQPINSVLDGVLPLHAASSGGNDIVVRLLIEKGADVNAPRLPRRYSSDKNRDTSAPIVGTSGSTPLHFACANGHTNVVVTLLLHGAHPDRPDKHGVTPEFLARQNGWVACADVVQQWSQNKDRDLREKDIYSGQYSDATAGSAVKESRPACGHGHADCVECALKKLRGKRSIENALHLLRPSPSQSPPPAPSMTLHDGQEAADSSPLPSPEQPSESPFHETPEGADGDDLPPRRPSLPHIFETPHTTPHRPSFGSSSSSKRPRSAGTDADQSPMSSKVKGKISLLNIFKRNLSDASGSPESFSGYNSSSSAITSVSGSPGPESSALPHSQDPSDSPSVQHPSSSSARRFRDRVFSESKSRSPSRPSRVADLHHTFSSERLRTRSSGVGGSGSAASVDGGSFQSSRSPPVRPSILRPHGRSASSGQTLSESQRSGSSQPSVRALRFDSSSTSASERSQQSEERRQMSRSPVRAMRASGSTEDLGIPGSPCSAQHLQLEPEPDRILLEVMVPLTVESSCVQNGDIEEEDEEEYGEPLTAQSGALGEKPPSDTLIADERTCKISDVSARPSPPPLPGIVIPSTGFECPFSINVPPPEETASMMASNTLGIHGIENRLRGDSVSSTSTTASNIPPSSSSDSAYLMTPALPQHQLPHPLIHSSSTVDVHQLPVEVDEKKSRSPDYTVETPLAPRAARTALDIDIGSISSHAQAEALVQRAQQSILDMQDLDIEFSDLASINNGRTPLSAALAAYGESLAIERKFKMEEERLNSSRGVRSLDLPLDEAQDYREGFAGRGGLDRKFSLEERNHRHHRKGKSSRPHTSNGTPSSDTLLASFSDYSPPSVRALSPSRAAAERMAISVRQPDVARGDGAASITPPRSMHRLKVHSQTLPLPRPHIPRSRTPDPDTDSLTSSANIPLSRVSTAPEPDGVLDYRAGRGMSEQERQAARANKLVKMGFQSSEAWQSTAGYPRGQAASKSHRFGGIKTLVQSLKGRT